MRYISTRGKTAPKNFLEIVLEGLASNGGLYMPESYPQIDLDLLRTGSYRTVAWHVMRLFAPEISSREMMLMLDCVYRTEIFGSSEITPLRFLRPNLALLRLANGPTLSFKDVAMQLLGALMEYALEKTCRELNILGATSGDTGSAAEYAVRGRR
jgi:threonine synthase